MGYNASLIHPNRIARYKFFMNLIKDNRPDVKKSRGTAYHRIPYAEFAEAVQNMRQTLSAKKRDELIIPG